MKHLHNSNSRTKKFIKLFCSFVLISSLFSFTQADAALTEEWKNFADTSWHTGHEADTELFISTPEQLAGLAKLVNEGSAENAFEGKTITLTADIDLSGKIWTPAGWQTDGDLRCFAGSFNGNGHTVSGLSEMRVFRTAPTSVVNFQALHPCYGLFGIIRSGSAGDVTVKNLRITGTPVNAEEAAVYDSIAGQGIYYGALAGAVLKRGTSAITVENIRFEGNITAKTAKGFHGSARGEECVGGIAGLCNAELSDCAVYGNIELNNQVYDSSCNYSQYTGGIAGKSNGGISSSVYSGAITSPVAIGNIHAGGITGAITSDAELAECAVTADINIKTLRSSNFDSASLNNTTVMTTAGGIAGLVKHGNISYCSAEGSITADSMTEGDKFVATGGIVGARLDREIHIRTCSASVKTENANGFKGAIIGYLGDAENTTLDRFGVEGCQMLTGDGRPDNVYGAYYGSAAVWPGNTTSDTFTTAVPSELKPVTVLLSSNSIAVSHNREYVASAEVFPKSADTSALNFIWNSASPALLSVTPSGKNATLKGLQPGKTTLTLSVAGIGSEAKSLKANVTVSENHPTAIVSDKTEIHFENSSASHVITLEPVPADAEFYTPAVWSVTPTSAEALSSDVKITAVEGSNNRKYKVEPACFRHSASYTLKAVCSCNGEEISHTISLTTAAPVPEVSPDIKPEPDKPLPDTDTSGDVTPEAGSGTGGCSAGFAGLALLLTLPFVLRRKK